MPAAVHLDQLPVVVLVFGMQGCPSCESFLPTFRAVAARHPAVPAYAVDSMRKEVEGAADVYKVKATPTTILAVHGRPRARLEGEVSEAELERFFQRAEAVIPSGV